MISKRKILIGSVIGALGIALFIHTVFISIPGDAPQTQTYTHRAPDIIRGNIITLKKLREEHFIDWHNMYSNKVRELFLSPKHMTLDMTIWQLRHLMASSDKGETLYYCIFDNKDDRLVGGIEIRENAPPGDLGCWINENYWGGGRSKEAIKLISKAYFQLNPHKNSYEAHVYEWNKRSLKAMKKAGLVEVKMIPKSADYKDARYVLEYRREFVKD